MRRQSMLSICVAFTKFSVPSIEINYFKSIGSEVIYVVIEFSELSITLENEYQYDTRFTVSQIITSQAIAGRSNN